MAREMAAAIASGKAEVVGRKLAEREAAGELKPEDKEAVYWRMVETRGREYADQAAGVAALESDPVALAQEIADGIARGLGLESGAFELRMDEQAAAMTAARGAGGLTDGNVVYLNPARFDAESKETRYVIAHELTHVAQNAGVGGEADKGGAEREAGELGQALADGQSVGKPIMSLPGQDIAADVDLDTDMDADVDEGVDTDTDTAQDVEAGTEGETDNSEPDQAVIDALLALGTDADGLTSDASSLDLSGLDAGPVEYGVCEDIEAPPVLDLGVEELGIDVAPESVMPLDIASPELAVPALPACSTREPDGLVDYYMETHWDRAAYDEACVTYNVVPEGVSSAIDALLGPDLTPGQRTAANFAYAAASGAFEAGVVTAACAVPIFGMIPTVVLGVKGAIDDVKKVPEQPGVMDGCIEVLDVASGIFGTAAGLVGNWADWVSFIEGLAVGIGTTAGTAVAPGAGTAAGAAAPTVTIGTVSVSLTAVETALQVGKTACDAMAVAASVSAANEAERKGDFRLAGTFRGLATDHAFRTIGDMLGLATKVGDMVGLGFLPSNAMTKAIDSVADHIVDWLPYVDKLAPTTEKLVSASFGWWEGLKEARGDSMKKDDQYVVPPELEGDGAAGAVLQGGRDATILAMEEAWGSLDGEQASWNQTLINTLLNPPSAELGKLLEPAHWMDILVRAIPGMTQGIRDLGIEIHAGTYDIAADGLAEIVKPGIDWLNDFIAENTDVSDIITEIDGWCEENKVTLENLRTFVSELEDVVDSVDEGIAASESIRAAGDELADGIGGLEMSPDMFGDLPDWAADVLKKVLEDQYNKAVGKVADTARDMTSRMADQYAELLEGSVASVQTMIDDFQLAIQEGGETETLLLDAQKSVQQSIEDFLLMASEFLAFEIDVDFDGWIQWLRDREAAAMEAHSSVRVENFLTHVATEGQQSCDTWRETFGPSVETAYYPTVPQDEVNVVTEAYALVEAHLGTLSAAAQSEEDLVAIELVRAEATAARDQALSHSGGQGKESVEAFWAAADDLASVAATVGM